LLLRRFYPVVAALPDYWIDRAGEQTAARQARHSFQRARTIELAGEFRRHLEQSST
jgi:hypothetical protein